MKPYDKPAKRAVITLLCVLTGNALLAFLVAAFIIPHDIIMGGTTGIGIVLHKAIPQMDVSLFVLILNGILLLIGLFTLGKKFAVTTVASSFLYPVLLGFFQRIPGIDSMTDNALIAAVFAGTLMGVALGLVMRVGSSTGGMDIVTLVLNKYTHIAVSIWVYITDIIVIGGQALFCPAEKTLLGIIVLVLEAIILDKAMILGKSQIQIFVISEAYEQIRQALMAETEAGVTMTMIETGWLKKQQQGVLCVIPQRKLYAATELIQHIDPQAFITITQIREVRGQGFTIEPKNIEQAI
jgi:uncharacterized membrane-anchored protein YitT (DUF2179 family)